MQCSPHPRMLLWVCWTTQPSPDSPASKSAKAAAAQPCGLKAESRTGGTPEGGRREGGPRGGGAFCLRNRIGPFPCDWNTTVLSQALAINIDGAPLAAASALVEKKEPLWGTESPIS